MSNSNIYIKRFQVNEEHQAIANLTTNEPVEDIVNINGVEYSKGGGSGVTLYCWKSDKNDPDTEYPAFEAYYYTLAETPSVGDEIYNYLNYVDACGRSNMAVLKSDRTVLEVLDGAIKASYLYDEGFGTTEERECKFYRYSDGDVTV